MRQIRLSWVLNHYDFVTVDTPEGEKEGSPQEVGLKPGDVVWLPAPDGGSDVDMWSDLAQYKVLPDLGAKDVVETLLEDRS